MINKTKPDTIISLQQKNSKLQKQIDSLKVKVLKFETKMLKQEQKIITLESKRDKKTSLPYFSPAQQEILRDCARRLCECEDSVHNEPPEK